MKNRGFCLSLTLFSLVCLTLAGQTQFISSAAAAGEKREPHVVLLISEPEYETEITLPAFAERHLAPSGLRCTMVFGDAAQPDTFPEIAALESADLLLLSVRRRALPTEQLQAVRQYLEAGKPLVGIRTACHAFHTRGKREEGHAEWQEFDPQVLGGHYTGHHGNGPVTTVRIADGAQSHPILSGLPAEGFTSIGSLYRVSPLAATTTTLLIGEIPEQPAEPVAWTHTFQGGRVFYTSLGHKDDFAKPEFNRLLLNAVFWALDRPVPDAARSLIQQAGNADSDAERLALLKQLRASPECGETLAADADRLIAFVEKWVAGKNLHFYSGEVSKRRDIDFGIAANSPLYPLTYLYRGRAVLTIVLQNGNLWAYPDRRREWFGIARGFFERAHAAFPENRIARMYLGEGLPWTRDWEQVAAAPEWAVQQRIGLEGVADIIEWWLDHRMQPNGAFGGGWGDDCEMWRWWMPVLAGFDDPKIRHGQARFSEALLSQPHMQGGYMSGMTDVEHSAEDSTDTILPMMHLEPDNPVWQRRAVRLAELMETLWTGRNQRGLLQFKSTYFTVSRVHEDPQKACDTPYHVRAVHPVFLYWLRTGDPQVGRLLSAWMDTWVDAAARSENGKPAGIIPAALHWPEGTIGGLSPDWWDPQNHSEPTLYQWPSAMGGLTDALLLTYHQTRDEKYLAPIRSMADIALKHADRSGRGATAAPGSEAWCAARMGFLRGTLAKYRLLTGDETYDRLLSGSSAPVLTLHRTGGRETLVRALTDAALAFSYNFERYTSEVRYTDRVLRFPAVFQGDVRLTEPRFPVRSPDPELLYSTVTGDPGGSGSFPLNAVRWLTRPREIAALVTKADSERLEAELFHFGAAPRSLGAELYLLKPGTYRWTLAVGDERLQDGTVSVAGPRAQTAFELPSRQLCRLTLTRE